MYRIVYPFFFFAKGFRIRKYCLQLFHPVGQFLQKRIIGVMQIFLKFSFFASCFQIRDAVLEFLFVKQNHPCQNFRRNGHESFHLFILPGKNPIDHFEFISSFAVHN